MQTGTLMGGDVQAYTSRVVVDGVQRDHLSWSVDRELAGDLPDQVVAGSGIKQATGNIQFAGDDVQGMSRNPFNRATGWLPRSGDRVQIFAGDTATEWVQFTGRIDRITGSLDAGFSATLIDDFDKLSAPVSHVPLLRIMPPIEEGGVRRGVGLSSTYYADLALRRSGFYATPQTESNPALSVPAQGSMWPDLGTMGKLSNGTGFEASSSHAAFYGAPWGYAAGNFKNEYLPRLNMAPTAAVQMTVVVAPDHAGSFFFTTYYGASTVQLAVSTGRLAILRVNGTDVCSVLMGADTIVTALIKGGTVTLKTASGTTSTGTATIGGSAMSLILANGDAATRVAGLQVSHPTTAGQEFLSLRHVPSAVMDMSNNSLIGLMDAGPAINAQPASELLSEISSSTLTAMWINEAGAFRWVPTLALQAQVIERTVTTLDDILALDWEDSLLGSRSSVTVNGKIPAITSFRWRRKDLYRGSGESMGSEDVLEDFVGPDADTDWIMPDEDLRQLGTSNWSIYNNGNETVGGVFYSSSGETISDAGLTMDITMEKLGVTKYKITHKAGVFPSDVTANLGTSPTSTALWPRNRDNALPVVKGFGLVQWAETAVAPVSVGGVGPELVHDAGVWNNRSGSTTIIERIAAYLADQTALPKPVITGLEIVYDPRIQLGDMIRIESPNLLGVVMGALVVGVNNECSGSFTQSLSVRIVSVRTTFTTYKGYLDSLSGANLTYAQHNALAPKPQTYEQFNDAA